MYVFGCRRLSYLCQSLPYVSENVYGVFEGMFLL